MTYDTVSVENAEQCLMDMIDKAGLELSRPDVLRIWDVFKTFAKIPVDCGNEQFLFECLMSKPALPEQKEHFSFHFLRQFGLEEDGEFSGLVQLDCDFTFEPHDELRQLQAATWDFEYSSLEEFFERVEQLPEFRVPADGYTPIKVEVRQFTVDEA